MKHIRNWKPIAYGISTADAVNVLCTQRYENNEGPFVIQSEKTMRMILTYDGQEHINIKEAGSTWVILVPDTGKEERDNKVRQMLKDANCTRLKYDKIDNMTLDEMWDYINDSLLDDDKKYKMIKYFCEAQIYKKTN